MKIIYLIYLMEDIEMIDETKPCDLKEVPEMDVVNSYKEDNESLKNEIKWPHQKKNKYSIEEKLSILEEAKAKSLHSVAKKYGIDRKSIRDRKNQEEQLEEQLNYKKYRIKGDGAKSQLSKENELDIVNWIIQTRKLELPVTSTLVMKYILKIAPELQDKTNKAFICLTYRLSQKYNFVLRRASHIG